MKKKKSKKEKKKKKKKLRRKKREMKTEKVSQVYRCRSFVKSSPFLSFSYNSIYILAIYNKLAMRQLNNQTTSRWLWQICFW